MQTVENNMKTTVTFSDNYNHRYLLQKTWVENKKKAMIIMIYPCSKDITQLDLTTMLVLNNLAKLDYGSVSILNAYSKTDANVSHDITETNTIENDQQIIQSAKDCDSIIIAWGKSGDGNKKVHARQKAVLKLLFPYKDKVFVIVDERGIAGLHPLTPSLRSYWELKKFDFPDLKDEPPKDELDSKKKRKKPQKPNEDEPSEEPSNLENEVENKEETEQ